MTDSNHVWLI